MDAIEYLNMFNDKLEVNKLRNWPRRRQWNYLQADLKKCKIFDGKKRSTDKDCWTVPYRDEVLRAVEPDKKNNLWTY